MMHQHPFHAPLLLPAASLAAGIAVGMPLGAVEVLCLLAGAIVAALFLGRWPFWQSAALGAGFLLLGMLLSPGDEPRVADGTWTEAVVASAPAQRPKTIMVELLLPATGERRRCYLWSDERSQQLHVGQNLMVCIHDGQFIGRSDWRPGGDAFNHATSLQRLRIRALQWRGRLLERYRSMEGDDEAQAVLAAMVLGDKSALTRDLRQTYSSSGASHVLALSGLHLSIIYLLLSRLTLGRRRWWLTQVLVVLAIWAYALLTGLSVSVVRAATMLTVYALFSLGGRRRSSLGVLSFTALVMLLVSPASLFDVGFQLSFMAMLAILLFDPFFKGLISTRWLMEHRPVKWVYDLAAVSFSAQLGTAPLVAYYFGQLPVWFLLTNLVVIPLATVILHGAVLVLVVPALGGALLWVVEVLNAFLEWESRLPLASISGLHPSPLQVVMAYVCIGVLLFILSLKPAAK